MGLPFFGNLVGLLAAYAAEFEQVVEVTVADRLLRCSIAWYSSGWVNAGSSPSLWPQRR